MAYIAMVCIVMASIVMAAHLLLPFAAHLRVVAKLCPACVCVHMHIHACVHVCACVRACMCPWSSACIQSSSVHVYAIEGCCDSIRLCAALPKACMHALAQAHKVAAVSGQTGEHAPFMHVDSFVNI